MEANININWLCIHRPTSAGLSHAVFLNTGFTIDLAHKDLSLVLNAANACKVPMPVGAATLNSFSLARASDNGMLDFSCIADVMCELAQIQKPRVPSGWKPT